MADYNIFREQLGIRFPTYGHALWDPCPEEPDKPVKIGVDKLEAEAQTANRAAQATYTSVFRSLDLFINILTFFSDSLPKSE